MHRTATAAARSSGSRRRDHLVTRLLAIPLESSAPIGVALILLQLALCTALTYALGGTAHIPPHWFYLPILFAGVRFGLAGAVATALAAGVMTGPVMPGDVATGAAQPLSDWLTRAALFAGIGCAITLVIERSSGAVRSELDALRLENEMHDALAQNQFIVHYQPIVSVDHGHIVGVEALVRWEHPERGILSPAAFVPDAEANDMIVPIGAFVLETACRQAVAWQTEPLQGGPPVTVAVNLSSRQLARPDITRLVAEVLRSTGLDPALLHLEITESALVEDIATSTERLLELKSLGVRIAVDDFGTGYSAFSYLRELPVDVVKIDQAFVAGLSHDAENKTIVGAVISLAHDLGKITVGEGVETPEQLEALETLGCDLVQGYLFAPPQPPELIEELLRSDERPRDDRTTDVPATNGAKPGSPVPLARWMARELSRENPVDTPSTRAHALATLFAAGTAVSWITLMLPHPAEVDVRSSATLSGLGLPLAVGLLWVGHRMGNWMFHALLASGTVIVTLGVYFAHGGHASISTGTFYVWVALYAAYFFDWRAASVHVGLAGVLFAAVLLVVDMPTPASIWAMLMGTVAVTGVVLGWLSHQMRAMAHTDILTGLPNRLALNGLLDREIVRSQRSGSPLCVAVVDIDDFKSVNDTHGHQAGDRVLAGLADRWRAALRTADILARYGGDEFVAVLPDCTVRAATEVLGRLIDSTKPGASVGVSSWTAGDTPDRLLARADEALYEAKRNGRNQVVSLPRLLTGPGAATPPTPAPVPTASAVAR